MYLPQYRCHKVVGAFRIGGIARLADGQTVLTDTRVKTDTPLHARVDAAWMAKHKPEVGGYYVVYAPDGYASYSPASAFEAGYTLIEETPI